jgi:hypothetical protein
MMSGTQIQWVEFVGEKVSSAWTISVGVTYENVDIYMYKVFPKFPCKAPGDQVQGKKLHLWTWSPGTLHYRDILSLHLPRIL